MITSQRCYKKSIHSENTNLVLLDDDEDEGEGEKEEEEEDEEEVGEEPRSKACTGSCRRCLMCCYKILYRFLLNAYL